MSALFGSADAAEWDAVFSTYADVCSGLETKLQELEAWYHDELPSLVKELGFITQPQLSRLMTWKLSKGKWRPRLQAFVDALESSEVEDLSKKAFDACTKKQYREAITALSEMKGVGPATASAVLAAFDENVPFMGDEALNAAAGEIGTRQYTLPHFVRFLDALQAKAKALNKSSSTKTKWTAHKVQICLWLETLRVNSEAAANKPSKKRGAKGSDSGTKKKSRK